MNTTLHLTAGNLTHIVNNLTLYKAEALATNSQNEVAIFDDGENEFVLNNATGLDYYRWTLFSEAIDENDGLITTFYARDLEHAKGIADTLLDHYQKRTDYFLHDEEGEAYDL